MPRTLIRAIRSAADHDCFYLAQATAYSAIFAFFPALIVLAALVHQIPDSWALRLESSALFTQILPPNTLQLLDGYFTAHGRHAHAHHPLLSTVFVCLLGGAGVIATLMESFRRAYNRPKGFWGAWRRRLVAIFLVPLSLIPLAVVSALLICGHIITLWLRSWLPSDLRTYIILLVIILRWAVAAAGSIGVLTLIYRFGSPVSHPIGRTVHGAVLATALWFPSTLAFGWYVTRFTDYSRVYGPLGAGIALLIWLNLIALCVITGAEYNAQRHSAR
jgi:membrane protein